MNIKPGPGTPYNQETILATDPTWQAFLPKFQTTYGTESLILTPAQFDRVATTYAKLRFILSPDEADYYGEMFYGESVPITIQIDPSRRRSITISFETNCFTTDNLTFIDVVDNTDELITHELPNDTTRFTFKLHNVFT